MCRLRRWSFLLLIVFSAFVGMLAVPSRVQAGSCVIQFTSAETEIKRGDIFTVVCQVSSSEPFLDTTFTIDYDDTIMQFIKGGKKISGGYGELQVESAGNSSETYKKTFSIQFMGKKSGRGLISVKGTAEVTDEEGNVFSVSSNRLSVHVTKNGKTQETNKPEPTGAVVTPAPVKSSKNRLKTLDTTAVSMTPGFSPDITEYRALVDSDTETLYFSFKPEDEKARVQILGNENLKQGDNQVSIRVTAENGNMREYGITVNRETPEETKERTEEGEEKGEKDVAFAVLQQGDVVFLQNSYKFEVLDTDGLSSVPEGYVQTRITLEGVSVPAFTMEDELDSNYLLLYLKGPSGESGMYQYDREEKTLQRYTGSMVARINRGRSSSGTSSVSSLSGYVMLGIIVVLVIVILCLLITMLKMAIRKKEPDKDMLDF